MITQRQAKHRINQIAKNSEWLDDAALFAEYSSLQKIANLHPSKMNEQQIRAEMADGNLNDVGVYGPPCCCNQSEFRQDSVGNYLIYRLRGGADMNRVSDAIGTFPSFGV
jgi:hypothetical protein